MKKRRDQNINNSVYNSGIVGGNIENKVEYTTNVSGDQVDGDKVGNDKVDGDKVGGDKIYGNKTDKKP